MSSVPPKRATVQLAINKDGSVASAASVSPGSVLRASLPLHSSVPGQLQGPAEPVLPPPPVLGERRPVSECTLCLFLHQRKVRFIERITFWPCPWLFFLNPCPSPPHTFQLGQLPQEKFSGSLLTSSQDFREKKSSLWQCYCLRWMEIVCNRKITPLDGPEVYFLNLHRLHLLMWLWLETITWVLYSVPILLTFLFFPTTFQLLRVSRILRSGLPGKLTTICNWGFLLLTVCKIKNVLDSTWSPDPHTRATAVRKLRFLLGKIEKQLADSLSDCTSKN